MNNLHAYLEKRAQDIISAWNEDGIYAISFFVNANESDEYAGCSNVPSFGIGYNTEKDCFGADEYSEWRWNYAFWQQNETFVIEADDDNEGMALLFEWYKENGIDNIGYEDMSNCYDSRMNYIGKGPVGYYELLTEVTAVAKKLQTSGFIENKFGRKIPIIIHDLEYAWYVIEATKSANPYGEADTFIKAMKKLGFIE